MYLCMGWRARLTAAKLHTLRAAHVKAPDRRKCRVVGSCQNEHGPLARGGRPQHTGRTCWSGTRRVCCSDTAKLFQRSRSARQPRRRAPPPWWAPNIKDGTFANLTSCGVEPTEKGSEEDCERHRNDGAGEQTGYFFYDHQRCSMGPRDGDDSARVRPQSGAELRLMDVRNWDESEPARYCPGTMGQIASKTGQNCVGQPHQGGGFLRRGCVPKVRYWWQAADRVSGRSRYRCRDRSAYRSRQRTTRRCLQQSKPGGVASARSRS
jgi:hypothetical protein